MGENVIFSLDTETDFLSPDATEGGDYADFLLAYMSHALPEDDFLLPDDVIEQVVVYLRSLTDQITPPPPELMDRLWDLYDQVARPVDGIEPGLVRDQLTLDLFPKLVPVDFTPLDPDGVEGAIEKLIASRKPKGLAETLILLLKGLKKLKELEPPANLKKKWRRTGPFQLLAIDDWRLSRSDSISSILNVNTNPMTISSVKIAETMTVPKLTDVVTVDIKGFLLMLTKEKVRFTYSGGILGNPTFVGDSGYQIGPVMCRTKVDFNPLKSKTCKLQVSTVTHSFPTGDISKLFYTIIASANVRFYSAIIDLG